MKGAWRVVVLVTMCASLWWPADVLALNPRLDISQYVYTAWRASEGFALGRVAAIVQTPDGYLWFATDDGLLKFDGVKLTRWQPPPTQPLPSNRIVDLVAARDGALWIGTDRGLVSWKDGRLTTYWAAEMPYGAGRVLQDQDGVMWVTHRSKRTNRRMLCSFKTSQPECHGEDGGDGIDAISLFENRKGEFWVGTTTGI